MGAYKEASIKNAAISVGDEHSAWGSPSAPTVVIVPVPDGFAHGEELKRLAHLAAVLLTSGMPERELARRLARYHPMVEG